MNPVIFELAQKADPEFHNDFGDMPDAIIGDEKIELFAKLIIEQ